MKTQTKTEQTSSTFDRCEGEKALARCRKRLEALDPGELLASGIDVFHGASVVLGSVPKIEGLMDELSKVPGMTKNLPEELRELAMATLFVDAQRTLSLTEAPAVRRQTMERLSEATDLRRRLLVQARSLGEFGAVSEDQVAGVPSGRSRAEVAAGLVALASIFEARWKALKTRTPVTEEVLARARALHVALLADAAHKVGGAGDGDAALDDLWRRMVTLFVRRWDEVRLAVALVRGPAKDARDFAPSLRRRAPAKRTSKVKASAPAATPATGDAKAPAVGAPAPEGAGAPVVK